MLQLRAVLFRSSRTRILRSAAFATFALSMAIFPAACSAQMYVYSGPATPGQITAAPLSDEDLDQLTAPIALYPDPLLAQILPAATYPIDVVAAEQWTRANPTVPDQLIDQQPWDESVKALVHYPGVLDMMSNDIAWTQRLGEAYLNQPSDVMDSIQRLRAQAEAAGSLVSTPQQQVVVDQNEISILPAEPEVIYVPVYDPAVIYFHRGDIRFGNPYHVGVWLDKDTDWHRHYVEQGIHWDRDHWELRDRRVEARPDTHDDHRPDIHPGNRPDNHPDSHPDSHPNGQQWHRDPQKPLVVHPDVPKHDDSHGYAPPQVVPQPPALTDVKPRRQAEHEEDRGRQSLHQPVPQREPAKPPPRVDTPKPPPPRVDTPKPPPPRVNSPQPPRSAPAPAAPAHPDNNRAGPPGKH